MARAQRNRIAVDDGVTLVRRNASSIWTARVWVKGQETWRSSGYRTVEPAKEWAKDLRARLELERQGLAVPLDKHTTVAQLTAEWRVDLDRRGRDAGYAEVVAKRALEVLGGFGQLDEVKPEAIRAALDRVVESRRVAPGTTKRAAAALTKTLSTSARHAYLVACRRFYAWLKKSRRVDVNPAAEVESISIVPVEPRRALALEEALRLLAVAPIDRRACYVLAMVTGLRRKELRALLWSSFTLEGRRPCVRLAGVRTDGRRTKNKQAVDRRLPEPVAATLRELRAWRTGQAKGRGGKPQASPVGWQDTDRAIEVPTNDTLRRDLAKAGVQAADVGSGKLTLHSLRSALSTGLKDLGVSLAVRQAAMRHSSPLLTENTYTDLHEGELDDAIAELGEVLAPALRSDPSPNLVAPAVAPTAGRKRTQVKSTRTPPRRASRPPTKKKA